MKEKEKILRDIQAKDEELRLENEAKERIKKEIEVTSYLHFMQLKCCLLPLMYSQNRNENFYLNVI